MLFNLGATLQGLALSADRSTADGNRLAAAHLQATRLPGFRSPGEDQQAAALSAAS